MFCMEIKMTIVSFPNKDLKEECNVRGSSTQLAELFTKIIKINNSGKHFAIQILLSYAASSVPTNISPG